jgi:RNA polymerase sigma factor, sigma-70 family
MPSSESLNGASPEHGGNAPDADSSAWLARLAPGARDRDSAIAELHGVLLRAARFTLSKRRSMVRDRRERLDDLAMEAADDALVAVLAHLRDYRGESRFTTWAWKFAVVQTSVALRRRDWTARELSAEGDVWAAVSKDASPHVELEQRELLTALKRGVETELTPHQRRVFVAIALNGAPIDVLAERLTTTRGALYKTLHDARHRLRAYLASVCLGPDGWRR